MNEPNAFILFFFYLPGYYQTLYRNVVISIVRFSLLYRIYVVTISNLCVFTYLTFSTSTMWWRESFDSLNWTKKKAVKQNFRCSKQTTDERIE